MEGDLRSAEGDNLAGRGSCLAARKIPAKARGHCFLDLSVACLLMSALTGWQMTVVRHWVKLHLSWSAWNLVFCRTLTVFSPGEIANRNPIQGLRFVLSTSQLFAFIRSKGRQTASSTREGDRFRRARISSRMHPS